MSSVHKLNLEALPWHHASLRSIQQALKTTSLCDTLFLFQPNTQEEPEQNPLWTLVPPPDQKESKSQVSSRKSAVIFPLLRSLQYAINIEIHQHPDSWVIHSSCSAVVMDIPGLEEILEVYNDALVQVVSRPGDQVMPADFPTVESNQSEPKTSTDSAQDEPEWEEDGIAAVIRGLLSQFSRIPEMHIRGTTSLASIGIDSVTAMQISSITRKKGIFVSPVTIIQSTSVRELVTKIREDQIDDSSGSDSASPLSPSVEIQSSLADVIRTTMPRHLRQHIEAIYPVSPGMEWMIGAWQSSGGRRYQHAFVRRTRGKIEIRRLERAWDALLRFHPILRSTFCPVPVVKENSDHLLALCVLDALPGRITRRKLPRLYGEDQALAAEARMSVIHPPTAPGMHARLTVLDGRSDSYLLLNLHHFQYGESPFLLPFQR